MIINFNLTSDIFIRSPEFLYAHEKNVDLYFSSEIYPLTVLLVNVNCAGKHKAYVTRDGKVDITEMIFPGELKIEVSLMHHDEKVKTWKIEPIVLKDHTDHITAIPAIEELKAVVQNAQGEIKQLKAAVAELFNIINDKSI